MRDTSLDAYTELRNSPKLGERQSIVYDAIRKLGCPTDLEITAFLNLGDPNKVRPRRNELLRKGYITECEKRECSISHKLVWSWRVK